MNPAAATWAANPALGAGICDEPGSLAAPASINTFPMRNLDVLLRKPPCHGLMTLTTLLWDRFDEFYREGWEAFLTQGVEAECPYPIGSGDRGHRLVGRLFGGAYPRASAGDAAAEPAAHEEKGLGIGD